MTKTFKKLIFILSLNAVVVVIYLLLAIFAKFLFTWQSSAITLWPAAGFANGLAITQGWIVFPGLAIGNLLATAFDLSNGLGFQTFMLPVCIAAAFQAYLVRWALFRNNLLDDTLSSFYKLLAFLLWIGPLGNWLAALTFFLFKLNYLSSVTSLDEVFTSSFFWWMGDSIGSLIILPLILLLLPIKHAVWRDRRNYLYAPLIVLLGVLFSAAYIERALLERINLNPELFNTLQDLRVLSTSAWLLLSIGVLGLIFQTTGKALDQEKTFMRSRLAAEASGAVIHEIGQPLIRLRLLLEELVQEFGSSLNLNGNLNSRNDLLDKSKLCLKELDAVVLNTKSIQDLTLAGIRDTDFADLEIAVNTVKKQLASELNRLDQDLSVTIDSYIPNIKAGQIQLQAVIRNLLKNSITAAGENGVIRININFSSFVIFEIENSGMGFDPLSVPNGYNLYKSTTGGMGLGLMIVRRVVDDTGGFIRFGISEELGGAKIQIYFKSITKK